jgi:hypothetical protein
MSASLLRIIIVAVVSCGVVGSFALSNQKKGERKMIVKVEKANAAVVKKASDAGRKSSDPVAPGLRNPNYRAD